MSGNKKANYQGLYERLERMLDEVTELILFTRSEYEMILEEAGERQPGLSPEAERRLDALVGALRFETEMKDDADYKKMYLILFNALTSAIQNLEWQNYERAREILICAQQESEQIFIAGA